MNIDSSNIHQIAWQIIDSALKAVDPATAVKNYFQDNPDIVNQIKAAPGRVIVIGTGKAGTPMAAAVSEILEDKIADGLVIVKYGHTGSKSKVSSRIKIKEAGHPVPDEAGFKAASEIADLLNKTEQGDVVLCLISGGGSALLTFPTEELELEDLKSTTQVLLAAGATINEVNTIRKHLSAVKGGGLARMAAPAKIYSLILSDVVGDPLEVIASGPTVPDPTTFADAWTIIDKYQLRNKLPKIVAHRLQEGSNGELADTPKPGDPIFKHVNNAIIGSNLIAAQAAVESARNLGFSAQLLSTFIEGEAREVARVVAGLAKGLVRNEGATKRPACLVLGGETTVTIKGDGQGGRNQEMALAAAIALEDWPDVFIVCLGTDGTDGPTDAAGAFADGITISRARTMGLDALQFLNRNDSYNFFAALDDLIITGPTNTNVNDLTIILAW